MKKIVFLLFTCCWIMEVFAQGTVVTFPGQLDADCAGKIVFTASPSSPLYDYTGDVYIHIGIVEGKDWVFVPAEWNENLDKCKMLKEADHSWSITLSPTIRQWFGADKTLIRKLGMVFRSSDGSKKGIAADTFVDVIDNSSSFEPGETVIAPRPVNTREGINIIDEQTVTFVLYEKDKNGRRRDYAYLLGDFNNWTLENAYQMKRDEETGCWWYTLQGLNPEQEYAFQYYVGSVAEGALRVGDPYCEKILDPANDPLIPVSTYPDLKVYPKGAIGIVSVFQTRENRYKWQVSDFKGKDKSQLMVYELHLRDFTSTGDLNGAITQLDYLERLGINAIELMPVQEFDGNDSWGYNPCYYFAMDKAYGTKEMYKTFIDECHKRGIAVILDVVYNHATGSHPFARLYWDIPNNKTSPENPWFNVDAPHPYSVFHDFNHESPLVRAFVKRNLEFLLDEYKIDGFRFDLTKGFTQTSSTESTASAYDASRVTILKDYNAAIKAVKPEAYVILEHFCAVKEERELAEDGMIVWRNMNDPYCQTAMGWKEGSAFSGLYYGNSMPAASLMGYMESHDEERTSYKAFTWGVESIKNNLNERMRQAAGNAAFFLTVPGPKMIWQFGELGYDYSIEENGRTGRKPIRWDYYDDPARRKLYDVYNRLLVLRSAYPDLFSDEASFDWKVGEENWDNGRFITLTSGSNNVVVVGNFTETERTFTYDLPASSGVWTKYAGEAELIPASEDCGFIVPAHDFGVFVNFDTSDNVEGLFADKKIRVYPNPVSDVLYVSSGEFMSAVIYSLSGVLVKEVKNENKIIVDDLPKGTYLLRLLTENTNYIAKFMKL